MLPLESEPDLIRARGWNVPPLEVCRPQILLLLCMYLSFVCTSHSYFMLLNQARHCHVDALSIFFSLHPFANILSAVLKLHAVLLAAHEREHYVAINYANVFQI